MPPTRMRIESMRSSLSAATAAITFVRPDAQPTQVEIMDSSSECRFHDIQVELMFRAVDNDGMVANHRRQPRGIAGVRERTGHSPASVARCNSVRCSLVEVRDENLILRIRFVQIAHDDAANGSSATKDNESRGGSAQYHPIGCSLRLMCTCLVSRNSSIPWRLSSRPWPLCLYPPHGDST